MKNIFVLRADKCQLYMIFVSLNNIENVVFIPLKMHHVAQKFVKYCHF